MAIVHIIHIAYVYKLFAYKMLNIFNYICFKKIFKCGCTIVTCKGKFYYLFINNYSILY